MKKKSFKHCGTTTGRTQRWGKGDTYNIRIDKLSIRGGITPKGEPSMILGMPAANEKDVYVTLKMDEEEKIQAILECIITVVTEASQPKAR